jgi:hypothetical protein
MRPVIGFAAVIVYRSAMSLPDSANTLLLVMKDRTGQGLTTPLKSPANAEEDTARGMLKLLDTTYPSGATDGVVPEALQAATAAKAGTVVLLTRGTLEDPAATSAMKSWTKKEDRRLILVSLGSHPMDAKQLENLAGEVGATFRSYDQYQLREFLNDAPLE